MDIQVLTCPRADVLVKITGGVGKGGEDKNLADGFAVAVDGGLADLGGDEFLQFRELAVTLGGDGLGFFQ